TGLLTVCYPYVSLEPIVTKLSGQNWIDATKKKNLESDRAINLDNLQETKTDVRALLLRSHLKMEDFMSLKVGDVIPFERKINSPIDVYVGNRLKYAARPGLSGKKKAFQVTEIYEAIVEEY
ncbi:MAG: FliM/FliN family flagellar motor switch protein, partial [bacterium]|nr:FliM/FliN family flagellar motor switch protein [bacterium]